MLSPPLTARSNLFVPGTKVQRIWDSTTLIDAMTCPRKYELAHLEGWTSTEEKIDLEWGRVVGEGLETFVRVAASGRSDDDALVAAVRRVLEMTWDEEKGRPTTGQYIDVWRCKGEKKYKNAKGNNAKCPWSHKGKLFPAPGPSVCGSCGSDTETSNQWFPLNKAKDRHQAVRAVVWYVEQMKGGVLRPVIYEDQPMVEWNATLPIHNILGTQFWLTVNFDKVMQVTNDEDDENTNLYVSDYKTTKYSLGDNYFAGFEPNVQVNNYNLVAPKALPPELAANFKGVAIEGIQTLVHGLNFGMRIFELTEDQRAEWWRELGLWLATFRQYALMGYWPRNPTACKFCQFRAVCAARPDEQPAILRANFERSYWNPLTRRREAESGLSGEMPQPAGVAATVPAPHIIVGEGAAMDRTDAEAAPSLPLSSGAPTRKDGGPLPHSQQELRYVGELE